VPVGEMIRLQSILRVLRNEFVEYNHACLGRASGGGKSGGEKGEEKDGSGGDQRKKGLCGRDARNAFRPGSGEGRVRRGKDKSSSERGRNKSR